MLGITAAAGQEIQLLATGDSVVMAGMEVGMREVALHPLRRWRIALRVTLLDAASLRSGVLREAVPEARPGRNDREAGSILSEAAAMRKGLSKRPRSRAAAAILAAAVTPAEAIRAAAGSIIASTETYSFKMAEKRFAEL